ncbi:MAG TPA: hypothetical protein VH478_20340 [Trebonia sp.]|jgi:hypothetical protein|nr:hypothetical protein [Trebonia sp.]
MSLLNTHGMMPTSASATGSGAAAGISTELHGMPATTLRDLGIALLVLTVIFAAGAIRGLLPRRAETNARREAAHLQELTQPRERTPQRMESS